MNDIEKIEFQIFKLKIDINSNYYSGYESDSLVNERIRLKRKLLELKKTNKKKHSLSKIGIKIKIK